MQGDCSGNSCNNYTHWLPSAQIIQSKQGPSWFVLCLPVWSQLCFPLVRWVFVKLSFPPLFSEQVKLFLASELCNCCSPAGTHFLSHHSSLTSTVTSSGRTLTGILSNTTSTGSHIYWRFSTLDLLLSEIFSLLNWFMYYLLPALECRVHQAGTLSYSPMYFWLLKDCLEHTGCSVTISWINELMNLSFCLAPKHLSPYISPSFMISTTFLPFTHQ